MAKNVNKIDHIVAITSSDRVNAITAELSWALQTPFYTFDRPEAGVRVVISHDAGFELVCGLSPSPEPAVPAWLSVVYGVRDVDAAQERLRAVGIEPRANYDGVSGIEPYCDRYERFDEAMYAPEVFAGLPMGFVQADERSDSRMAGPRPKNINHIDHVVGTVPLEGFQETIDKLSFVLQTAFYGPYDRADGMRVAASWDAGIVITAPLDPEVEVAPGWTSLGYGVRDLDQSLLRLKRAGFEPTEVRHGLVGDEPWSERFAHFKEARFEPSVFSGLQISLTDTEEHPDQQNVLAKYT